MPKSTKKGVAKPKKTKEPKKKNTKGSAPQDDKNKGGRPSLYRPEYAEQAKKLCLLHNATDKDLAEFFEVDERTINRWKIDSPEFCQSIRAGKVVADTEVANGLFNRAIGAKWIEEAAFKVKKVEFDEFGRKTREFEEVVTVSLQKAAPSDTQAAALWLKNRRPEQWRDKPEAPEDDDVQPVNITINTVDGRKNTDANA